MGVYAGKVALKKAIETARECGIEVGGFELAPNGTIKIIQSSALPRADEPLFDKLKREGKL